MCRVLAFDSLVYAVWPCELIEVLRKLRDLIEAAAPDRVIGDLETTSSTHWNGLVSLKGYLVMTQSLAMMLQNICLSSGLDT